MTTYRSTQYGFYQIVDHNVEYIAHDLLPCSLCKPRLHGTAILTIPTAERFALCRTVQARKTGTFRTLRAGAGEELIRTGGLDGTEGSVNHYWQPGRVLEFLSELGCVWLLDNGVHTANQALCIVPPLEFHGRPV